MKKIFTKPTQIIFLIVLSILYACSEKKNTETFSEEIPYYGEFKQVPVKEIKPNGWLRRYLLNQRNGLTGHLEEAGYPFNAAGWGKKVADSSSWWPYEQTGYWIDGMITAGYLLNDSLLLGKAKDKIYPVLKETGSDHFIGPNYLKKRKNKHRWVHTVYFRALMREYVASGDQMILQKMKNFYLYQDEKNFYEIRDQLNIENILWIYQQTGDTTLYKLAAGIYDKINYQGLLDRPVTASSFLKLEPVYEHGVTYNEAAKLGAILYLNNGDKKYLDPSVAAYDKIDKYYMMVDGVNVSSEHLRTPPHSLQTHETCDIADFSWSLGYLLMATGDATYADKIEKAIFNAAPGSVTSDFKALQYLSGPNQVILDSTSNHNKFFKGNTAMMFGPNQFTECCPGNVNRIMPNYVSRLWMKNKDKGIAAVMYGPSEWNGIIHGVNVDIKQDTRYPFSDDITFEFSPETAVDFSFTFRIPAWCKEAEVKINGEISETVYEPGKYYSINRNFETGDRITLILPQKARLSNWPNGGVALERGPLVYSLKINENWQALEPDKNNPRSTSSFPAYHLYPKSDWNYALALKENNLESQIKVIYHKWNNDPWNTDTAPISIKVPAKKINQWKIINKDTVFYAMNTPIQENGKTIWREKSDFQKKGQFSFTPALPSADFIQQNVNEQLEEIILIPYGSAKLRMTIFPIAPQ